MNDVTSQGTTESGYDIALSFAGEDRVFAEDLATRLREVSLRVFYDHFEASHLWGKNLYEFLSDLYQNQAKFCVILVSRHYAAKDWPRLERAAAEARAFRQLDEYILPIRLDDARLPGLPETTGYIDARNTSVEGIVALLEEKLKTKANDSTARILALCLSRTSKLLSRLRDGLLHEFFDSQSDLEDWRPHVERLCTLVHELQDLSVEHRDSHSFATELYDCVCKLLDDSYQALSELNDDVARAIVDRMEHACLILGVWERHLPDCTPDELPVAYELCRPEEAERCFHHAVDHLRQVYESHTCGSKDDDVALCRGVRRVYLTCLFVYAICPRVIAEPEAISAIHLFDEATDALSEGRPKDACMWRLWSLRTIVSHEYEGQSQ